MRVAILSLFLLVVLLSELTLADPYIGDEPPPNSIISKHLMIHPENIIGKIEIKENDYMVYYFGSKGEIYTANIIKLDTKKWLFRRGQSFEWMLVEAQ